MCQKRKTWNGSGPVLSRVKCLPLEFWMTLHLSHRIKGRFGPGTDDWPVNATPVEPVFRVPGWYYCRFSKQCWFELPDGTAYKGQADTFLYNLAIETASEYSPNIVRAIGILERAGLATKQQIELKKIKIHEMYTNDIRRGLDGYRARQRFRAFKNKHNL